MYGRYCYTVVMKQAYIIDNGSFYSQQLASLLQGYKINIRAFDDINRSEIADDSLIILTGGHKFKVQWHDKQYSKEIALIKSHHSPIIGVCLGAQLIAHVYGVHLHTLKENRKGTITIHSTNDTNRLFEGKKDIRVYENHHLSLQQLHDPLIDLARSEDGVEVFRHQTKPIYGIQFHPEVLNDNEGLQLFNSILENVSAKS